MKTIGTTETHNELVQHAIDKAEGIQSDSVHGCDLHHELFNMDYFIIGYYNAEQFLNKIGTFEAIGEVQEYEKENFGECNTDLGSSESVVNMYAYIKGEEILQECETLQNEYDNLLSLDALNKIREELKGLLID